MRTRKRYSALNLGSLSLHLVGLVFYLVTLAMGQISNYYKHTKTRLKRSLLS